MFHAIDKVPIHFVLYDTVRGTNGLIDYFLALLSCCFLDGNYEYEYGAC